MNRVDRRPAGYGEAQSFLRDAVAAGTDECIPWPFQEVHGYGRLKFRRRMTVATHVALEMDGRPRPLGPRSIALHSCDNPPCVNPRHLRWGSDLENSADRDTRGRHRTRRGSAVVHARLNESDVPVIRAAVAGGETRTSVAERYGVSRQAISLLVARETWSHIE